MLKWLLVACSALACTLPLTAEQKIIAISGSTRKDSWNKKLVSEAAQMATQMGAKVTIIDLRDYQMPFYDADEETQQGMPEKAKQLRQLMIGSDAVIIASPEYNGSLSAVLKNVIDWMSRSENGQPSRDAFKGKKFVIMSTSPGPGGGSRGLDHLRTIITNIGGEVLEPQITVPNAHSAFTEQGTIKDPKIKEQLRQEIQQIAK